MARPGFLCISVARCRRIVSFIDVCRCVARSACPVAVVKTSIDFPSNGFIPAMWVGILRQRARRLLCSPETRASCSIFVKKSTSVLWIRNFRTYSEPVTSHALGGLAGRRHGRGLESVMSYRKSDSVNGCVCT